MMIGSGKGIVFPKTLPIIQRLNTIKTRWFLFQHLIREDTSTRAAREKRELLDVAIAAKLFRDGNLSRLSGVSV